MLDLDYMTPVQARRLRELADSFQPQFLEMLRSIGKANNGSLAWLLSSLASRDRYRSPLLDRCCKLLLVAEALDKGEREFATRDTTLAKVIRRMCLEREVSFEIKSEWKWLPAVLNVLKLRVFFLLKCWRLLVRWCGRKPLKGQPERLILLDIFVGPDSVNSNGHFSDRYYCGWEKHITPEEVQRVKYLPTLCGFEDEAEGFKALRESHAAFLIPDDYLTWRDYLWIVRQTIKMAYLRLPALKVERVSIDVLLREERGRSFADWSGMLALLSYRFAWRSAETGLRVERLVDWSENQVVDRGLVLGFHKFHPETQVVAYKGYPLSENFHPHLCPSKDEMEAKVHPQETWVIGNGYGAALRAEHSKAVVRTGPALRYQSIFKPTSKRACPSSLLVGLSVDPSECEEILSLVKAATPNLPETMPVHIKPHPMLSRNKLVAVDDLSHDQWSWVEGEFSRHLHTARLFCTNVSSTALEALAAGVPVLLLGRRGEITWHPIPDFLPDQVWSLCFSAEELVETVQRLVQCQRKELHLVAAQVKEQCFDKPSPASVQGLLGISAG